MKKIIGVLGVAMIIGAMFFASNNITEANSTNLANLISMNTANAEGTGGNLPGVGTSTSTTCWGMRLTGVEVIGATWEYVAGHNYDCTGWTGYCEWSIGCRIDNP